MKRFTLILLALLFIGNACLPTRSAQEEAAKDAAMNYPRYKEIERPAGYINTDQITLGELVGKKVILLDMLTYSCINCVRTFPYLNAWYKKYKDNGLEIVGIHTPEFAFEKKYENVADAMKKYNIQFPVVLDNDYATWSAYGNRYWPRKYLIDIHGNIVYDHIGEGNYEETERKIQELLEERMNVLGAADGLEQDMAQPGDAVVVETGKVKSPEIYFGSARNERLGNGRPFTAGLQSFTAPARVRLNDLYFAGDWRITPEYAENTSKGASILFRYSAKVVNIVASAEGSVSARVLLDGKPIGEAAGSDVRYGQLEVEEDALYEIVNDPAGYGEHTLEIIIEEPGLRAFTFTFG